MVRVSVIIRSKNEERLLGRTLESLERQSFQDFEVVLVDSGSTDTTLDIAKKFTRVRIVEIPERFFTYGYALNVGVRCAVGQIFVNLSAHCVPINSHYLEYILEHLSDHSVAGVYGRQLPLPEHCHHPRVVLTLADYDKCWGSELKVQTDNYFFSNANAAIRRSLWEDLKFDETLPYCEDWAWAKEVQRIGYKIIYDPRAAVYHSHISSNSEVYKIAMQLAAGKRLVDPERYVPQSLRNTVRAMLRNLREDWRNALKRGNLILFAHAVPYRIAYLIGEYNGLRRSVS